MGLSSVLVLVILASVYMCTWCTVDAEPSSESNILPIQSAHGHGEASYVAPRPLCTLKAIVSVRVEGGQKGGVGGQSGGGHGGFKGHGGHGAHINQADGVNFKNSKGHFGQGGQGGHGGHGSPGSPGGSGIVIGRK